MEDFLKTFESFEESSIEKACIYSLRVLRYTPIITLKSYSTLNAIAITKIVLMSKTQGLEIISTFCLMRWIFWIIATSYIVHSKLFHYSINLATNDWTGFQVCDAIRDVLSYTRFIMNIYQRVFVLEIVIYNIYISYENSFRPFQWVVGKYN